MAFHTIVGGEALRDCIKRGEFSMGHHFQWSDSDIKKLAKLIDPEWREPKRVGESPGSPGATVEFCDSHGPIMGFIAGCKKHIGLVARRLSFMERLPSTAAKGPAPTIRADMKSLGALRDHLKKAADVAEGLGAAGSQAIGEVLCPGDYQTLRSGISEDNPPPWLDAEGQEFPHMDRGLNNFRQHLNYLQWTVYYSGSWLLPLAEGGVGAKGRAISEMRSYLVENLAAEYRKALNQEIIGDVPHPFDEIFNFFLRILGIPLAERRPLIRKIQD